MSGYYNVLELLFLSTETQRDIHQKSTYELTDAGLEGIHLSFYLTSIYDHSIFEVQRFKIFDFVKFECFRLLVVLCRS